MMESKEKKIRRAPKHNELFVDKRNLYGYRFIPKVASTSILNTILVEEFKLEGKEIPKKFKAHQFARQNLKDLSSVQDRIIIIRDPITRFLSGYDNCLNRGALDNLPNGLSIKEPSTDLLKTKSLNTIKKHNSDSHKSRTRDYEINFNYFVKNFDLFCEKRFIEWHLATFLTYIGPNGIDNFNIVIKITELYELEKYLSKIYGKPIKFRKRNITISNKTILADINKNSFDFLMDYTSEDYKMLKNYYQKDSIFAAWKEQRNV